METPTIWQLNNSDKFFERVEQMLITLFKSREYLINTSLIPDQNCCEFGFLVRADLLGSSEFKMNFLVK